MGLVGSGRGGGEPEDLEGVGMGVRNKWNSLVSIDYCVVPAAVLALGGREEDLVDVCGTVPQTAFHTSRKRQ